MSQGRFYLTRTALKTLKAVGRDTQRQWGKAQARKYVRELMDGFQYIAENHKTFPRREEMTGGAGLSLHYIGHHYVAFRVIAGGEAAIAGILHENMNIPNRLQELQAMTRQEIAIIEALIAREHD